jgi:hypothetical protein
MLDTVDGWTFCWLWPHRDRLPGRMPDLPASHLSRASAHHLEEDPINPQESRS